MFMTAATGSLKIQLPRYIGAQRLQFIYKRSSTLIRRVQITYANPDIRVRKDRLNYIDSRTHTGINIKNTRPI